MTRNELESQYLADAGKYSERAATESRTLLLLSFLRLAVFITGIFLAWFTAARAALSGSALLVLDIIVFLILLKRFSVHTDRKEYYSNLEHINRDEARAVVGDFSMFGNGSEYARRDHDFSYDLDLFGDASLFQFLNRTCTGYGSDKLAEWLSDPLPNSALFEARQKLVRELSQKKSWRHDFSATGRNRSLDKNHISGLSGWLEKEDFVSSSSFLTAIIKIMPALAILSLILLCAGIISYLFFLIIVLIDSMIIFFNLRRSNAIHEELTGKYLFLDSMSELFRLIEDEPFDSLLLNSMKSGTVEGTGPAARSLRELGRIIRAFDGRLNIMAGLVLNGIFLWDLYCIRRLEKWKARYREQFPLWLDMAGQIDAFSSLGNYAYNNSAFTFPVISDDGKPFSAKELGHPLIEDEKRVCNDFELPGKGKICIISGANMAGKSTFLRSVAVNHILAMTGAPVCSSAMSFLPVSLFTSMRTTDSLSTGESYFYAELKRLKSLEQKIESGADILFILDEILKGTNSDDKSQGSGLFLRHLIELGATGLIATHDTSLGTLEKEYTGVILNKCIEVEIDGENIIFDYKLREGIASKKNAVILMKKMGIIP